MWGEIMLETFSIDLSKDFGWIAAIIAVVLGIVEKSGIKWNPYSVILKAIGRGINGEMLKKIEDIEKNLSNVQNKIDCLDTEVKENAIVNCRTQFTRFGDEIRHGIRHSKDHFDQTLMNITKYEQYCQVHQDFANNVTEATARLIKRNYEERLEKNDFLE